MCLSFTPCFLMSSTFKKRLPLGMSISCLAHQGQMPLHYLEIGSSMWVSFPYILLVEVSPKVLFFSKVPCIIQKKKNLTNVDYHQFSTYYLFKLLMTWLLWQEWNSCTFEFWGCGILQKNRVFLFLDYFVNGHLSWL